MIIVITVTTTTWFFFKEKGTPHLTFGFIGGLTNSVGSGERDGCGK
jgi:hypothetical protein